MSYQESITGDPEGHGVMTALALDIRALTPEVIG
jgi:hypothetical protein